MATSAATSRWLNYFAEAGLPSNVAANYAIIFTENRIQPDMLLDLNKEYLYDMGIKVMGDVIAILRHARTAYTQNAQQQILGETPSTSIVHTSTPKMVTVEANATPKVPLSPASRLVKHYTKQPIQVNKDALKKKLSTKGKNIISLKRNVDDDFLPPSKKVAINQKKQVVSGVGQTVKLKASTNRSVFNRLGESSVSSSTDAETTSSSIFKRLGPSTQDPQISASSTVNDEPKQLQYRGVLKPTKQTITFSHLVTNKPTKIALSPSSTLRSQTKSQKRVVSDGGMTIRTRLGPSPSPTQSTRSLNQSNLLVKRSLAAVGLQKSINYPKPRISNLKKSIDLSSNRQQVRLVPRTSVTAQTRTVTNQSNKIILKPRENQRNLQVTSNRIVRSPLKSSVFERLGN